MNAQVLVAYATKHGATEEIAQKIGDTLRKNDLPTDVLPVNKVRELANYKAVVLGSAVYLGQWRKEAARIGPRDIVFFHGLLDPSDLNLAERLIIKGVKAPLGDFRDWESITGWAKANAAEIKTARAGKFGG